LLREKKGKAPPEEEMREIKAGRGTQTWCARKDVLRELYCEQKEAGGDADGAGADTGDAAGSTTEEGRAARQPAAISQVLRLCHDEEAFVPFALITKRLGLRGEALRYCMQCPV